MSKCLWVVPKAIFPVRDGARVANNALIKSMKSHFGDVDLLMFNESDKEKEDINLYKSEYGIKNVFFIKKISYTNKFQKIFFFLRSFLLNTEAPLTSNYFISENILEQVRKVILRKNYDYIVFDGLHPYRSFREILETRKSKLIYRAHNIEGDLWLTASAKTKNFIFSKALIWQGRKMHQFEESLVMKSSRVWCIAPEDLERFSILYPEQRSKMYLVPVGLDFSKSERKEITEGPIKLLFLGKMDWAPNKDGLKWFLEEVWPHVDHSKLELDLVGSGDASWLGELKEQPNIRFHGFVNDVTPFYEQSDFSIIPIRYGSGTRIKVIESISKGVPIISTKMGVQGSGLLNYINAETKSEWINSLNALTKARGQELSESSFNGLRDVYSPASIAKKAFSTLR